ncbi:MAG: 4-hydroxybenzoate octaprenyltransferase [Betaproteobacteria bacterium]|nr:4-hydroxybenzoate octaprenyltransferase [Betaproteobacteria bacterium]
MTFIERLTAYEKLIRLDKPIGILLLLWPTLWALWLSSRGRPDWTIVWIFVLGTVLMRSAGCAINDYADRDFDARVARTRERPLATGQIRPMEALMVAVVLILASFALVMQLNSLTIKLSVVAVIIAAIYPFAKRFFAVPQAVLGLAFGFGIPMAFAAHTDHVPWGAWVLLAANVFWAIAYDTEYAMVDREDDRKIGIRTSAITFGRHDVAAVMGCHVLFLLIMIWIGRLFRPGWYFYLGLAVAAGLVAVQHRMIRDRDPAGCFRAFRNNNWVGAAIFAGIFASFYFQKHI